jgi:hypothetical protein
MKKSSLIAIAIVVAVAVGCSCGWKLTLAEPRTMLAQDGTALEGRWSAERVDVGCCWVLAMLGQIFTTVVLASLTIPPSTQA